ncbi:MAG: elongation factor G [Oscillospiraceae bacterium]
MRNVMLCGHSSSGKTSLAEALLFATKSTDRFGTIADGTTVMDSDPEEIRRKVSISLSVAPLEFENTKINLIDVPGLFDFELGIYEGIKAADGVVICVSARSGVSVGQQKAFKLALKHNKARMFYMSKMATENADFAKTFDSLKASFGSSVCPVVVPVQREGKPNVYVDLLEMKGYTYTDGKASLSDIPDTDGYIEELVHELNEAVAETDETLMEKFFADEPLTHDEIVTAIRKAAKDGALVPVICGDSQTMEGIDLALRYIKRFQPSPADKESVEVTDKDNNKVSIKYDPSGPLVAYVFKTVADPFVGKLSFVKVVSGRLTSDAAIVNATTGEQERPGKLLGIKGKKQLDVKEIVAGDIGAVTKLADTKTGDTLCLAGKVFKLEPIEFPAPCMSMAVFTKNKGDESKVVSSIQKIIEEDRTVKYYVDSNTAQQILSGLGEQHLDVVVTKIKSKFGVELGLEVPRIAYRETIRATAEAEGKHKKQSGGSGQYGVVSIKFEPLMNGEDFEFVNAIVGGVVPKEYIPAVEKGLREALQHGVLAGYPMTGIKATLFDGKYHPVDSKEVAFKSAARLAYKAACVNAKPTLLEPIGKLSAYVPDSNTGDIMGEVNKRRGRVLGMNPAEDCLQLVEAEVPMSEMYDFTTFMRSSTQGRGHFSLEFTKYEPLPQMLEQKVIEDAKELREAEEE